MLLAKESRKSILFHVLAIIAILIVNIIYFMPQLEGKKLRQVDIISSRGQGAETKHYSEKTGELYLWANGQFSGMPRLMGAPAKNNYIIPIYKYMRLGFKEPIGLFFVLMTLYYLMLVFLGVPPLLSLAISIGVGLSVNNLLLWEAGHNSKIRTLVFTPLIISGVILLFEKQKYWIGGILLTLGLTLSIYTRHPQMSYYLLLALLIYGIVKLIKAIKNGEYKAIIIPVLIGVVGALLALGASASKMWSIYDYSEATMRGKSILKKEANVQAASSSHVDGLDWDYAMGWSNGALDLLAGFIPGLTGGGSNEKVKKNSASYKKYRIERVPLYWGSLPFTEGPIYFGAIFVFLFVFGLFYVKGDLKWWLGLSILFMCLLSMGKHFELLNRFVFNYFPLYNKFRTPQSILSVGVFLIPILGGLALKKIYEVERKLKKFKKSKKLNIPNDFKRSLMWATGICTGLALLFALFGPTMLSFDASTDARYVQQGTDVSPFIEDRKSLLRSDAFRSFAMVLLFASIMWFYMNRKLSRWVAFSCLGILMIFDMWSLGKRYLAYDDFVTTKNYEDTFEPRPVDRQILSQEKDRHGYRVFDLSINTFNSSLTTVHHNTIGGYDPAKLQRYQDLIDHHISRGNQAVLDMLNTKYIIQKGQDNQPLLQRNPSALGNAWFIDQIVNVNTANEEIDALTKFNPVSTAIVFDTEFNNYIGAFDPIKDFGGKISLSKYEPDHLIYSTSASAEQLAVFSEVWYGPNKGWQAYIDDNPVDHIRVNYVLRALRVPAGQHTVEFKFRPKSYYIGEKIALGSSLIILLLCLGFIAMKSRTLFNSMNNTNSIKSDIITRRSKSEK